MMSRPSAHLSLSIVSGLLLTGPAAAQLTVSDAEYDCKIIATSDQFPSGLFVPPTIDAFGRVAFEGWPAANTIEIRVGEGETDLQGDPVSNAIARAGFSSDPDEEFYSLESAVIANDGMIYWHGDAKTDGPPESGIYRKHLLDPLGAAADYRVSVATAGLGSPYGRIERHVRANANGTILYGATHQDPSQDGLRWGTSEAALLVSTDFAGPWSTTANRQPWYAFTRLDTSTHSLYLASTSPRVVVDSAERMLTGLSVAGAVNPLASFVERVFDVPGTTWQIRLVDPLATETLLDDGIDTTGVTATPVQTAVNSFGEVAVGGIFSQPLLFTDGDVLRRVVCRDMAVSFGSSIFFEQDLSDRAINNDGQIAFRGIAGSKTYIVRADPLVTAHPTSCVGLPDDTPCNDDDPESVAYCSAGVCLPVPEPSGSMGLLLGAVSLSSWRRRRGS